MSTRLLNIVHEMQQETRWESHLVGIVGNGIGIRNYTLCTESFKIPCKKGQTAAEAVRQYLDDEDEDYSEVPPVGVFRYGEYTVPEFVINRHRDLAQLALVFSERVRKDSEWRPTEPTNVDSRETYRDVYARGISEGLSEEIRDVFGRTWSFKSLSDDDDFDRFEVRLHVMSEMTDALVWKNSAEAYYRPEYYYTRDEPEPNAEFELLQHNRACSASARQVRSDWRAEIRARQVEQEFRRREMAERQEAGRLENIIALANELREAYRTNAHYRRIRELSQRYEQALWGSGDDVREWRMSLQAKLTPKDEDGYEWDCACGCVVSSTRSAREALRCGETVSLHCPVCGHDDVNLQKEEPEEEKTAPAEEAEPPVFTHLKGRDYRCGCGYIVRLTKDDHATVQAQPQKRAVLATCFRCGEGHAEARFDD